MSFRSAMCNRQLRTAGGVSQRLAVVPRSRFPSPLRRRKRKPRWLLVPSYVRKRSQVVIKHELGQVLSVIELVSPGNKHAPIELQRIVSKSVDLIHQGIHVLLVDPFPPTPRDPQGLANLIWYELDESQELPFREERPLSATAFQSQPQPIAHISTFAVGDPVPPMPVFLIDDRYVTLPLEESYERVWTALPRPIKGIFTG